MNQIIVFWLVGSKRHSQQAVELPQTAVQIVPIDGYGLGFMDCEISFSQAVIFEEWVDDLPSHGFALEGKFWSDDGVDIGPDIQTHNSQT